MYANVSAEKIECLGKNKGRANVGKDELKIHLESFANAEDVMNSVR